MRSDTSAYLAIRHIITSTWGCSAEKAIPLSIFPKLIEDEVVTIEMLEALGELAKVEPDLGSARKRLLKSLKRRGGRTLKPVDVWMAVNAFGDTAPSGSDGRESGAVSDDSLEAAVSRRPSRGKRPGRGVGGTVQQSTASASSNPGWKSQSSAIMGFLTSKPPRSKTMLQNAMTHMVDNLSDIDRRNLKHHQRRRPVNILTSSPLPSTMPFGDMMQDFLSELTDAERCALRHHRRRRTSTTSPARRASLGTAPRAKRLRPSTEQPLRSKTTIDNATSPRRTQSRAASRTSETPDDHLEGTFKIGRSDHPDYQGRTILWSNVQSITSKAAFLREYEAKLSICAQIKDQRYLFRLCDSREELEHWWDHGRGPPQAVKHRLENPAETEVHMNLIPRLEDLLRLRGTVDSEDFETMVQMDLAEGAYVGSLVQAWKMYRRRLVELEVYPVGRQ